MTLLLLACVQASDTASLTYATSARSDADADGDGFGENDCDDADAGVSPAATEDCANSRDDDCDGEVDQADSACSMAGLVDISTAEALPLFGMPIGAPGDELPVGGTRGVGVIATDGSFSAVEFGGGEMSFPRPEGMDLRSVLSGPDGAESLAYRTSNTDWTVAEISVLEPPFAGAEAPVIQEFTWKGCGGGDFIAVGDQDGDGLGDYAWGGGTPECGVRIVAGGSGDTREIGRIDAEGTGIEGIGERLVTGDLDGDGLAELVVLTPEGEDTPGRLYVHHLPLRPGTRLEEDAVMVVGGSDIQDCAIVPDQDQDGSPELAVAWQGERTADAVEPAATLYRGITPGTWLDDEAVTVAWATWVPRDDRTTRIAHIRAAGDSNHDGILDVLLLGGDLGGRYESWVLPTTRARQNLLEEGASLVLFDSEYQLWTASGADWLLARTAEEQVDPAWLWLAGG